MILLYKMIHKHHNKPIELCGEFDSWEHFRKFQLVENYRGWFVIGEVKQLK